jgi:CheY-like chemotaxis protein
MIKILLVDDDPLLVRMYHKKLQNDGYEVDTASDGMEALEKLPNFFPDLILLDMMMPKMNGLEMLQKLQSNEKTKKIPVIMLTNVSSKDANAEKALEFGAVAYIVKAGNRPKVVVDKVKEILAGYKKEEVHEVKSTIEEG